MSRAKRFFCPLFLVLLLTALPFLPARADIGPKPSVTITFSGAAVEGRSYYCTLLGEGSGWGPWLNNDYEDWRGEKSVWQVMHDYTPPAGYTFWGFYADCTGTDSFKWGYYPPERFYILLWLPDEGGGEYLLSPEPYERYAFASEYTITIAADGSWHTRRSYDWTGAVIGLLLRAALTVAVEAAVGAAVFGLHGRAQLELILRVNLCTQLGLNLLLNWANYSNGPMLTVLVYGLLEICVFIIEGAVYTRRLHWPEGRKPHPWLLSLGANGLSCFVGALLLRYAPELL